MKSKFVAGFFCFLVIVTLLTPFWVFRDLLFPYITSKAYFLRIMVEISLPFYVYLVLSEKKFRPNFRNPLSIAVVSFLILNIVSALVGVNPLKSFWGNFERMGGVIYILHLTLLYFYVLLLGQIGQQYMRWFVVGVILTAAAVALDGLCIKLTHNHFFLSDPSYPRVSGTFGNPIFIASFLIIPMLLTLYYLLAEENKWMKLFYGAIVILELYVILLSETRGAIVGLLIGLFVASALYVIFNPNSKIRRWGGLGVLIFTILVVTAFTQHSKFAQGSMLYRVFNLKDSNTEARLIQWRVALTGFKDHPIFGVGAENYYYISNKYYNPQIFTYDPSWFDKPHNYWIEVLVTSGILGFIAYASISVIFIWILWRSFKSGLVTLLEGCLLLTGFLAYGFQNLFVFDTIPASVMFFVILGFAGFLWHESRDGMPESKKNTVNGGLSKPLIYTATTLSAAMMVYVVYVANISGLQVAKAINYGYAYSSVDGQISQTYFQKAVNSPFDFDPVQTSSKYADSAVAMASNPGKLSDDFIKQIINDAIVSQQDAITRVPNDPTAWQELANLYLTQSIYTKSELNQKAWEAAQEAMNLAPKRPEPELLAVRLKIAQNDLPGAESLLEDIIKNIPQDTEAKMQLGLLYHYTGQDDKALEIGEQVLASPTFHAVQINQIDWLAQIYIKKENYAAAANIYNMETEIDPNSINSYWNLAQAYVKIGKISDARTIVESLMSADPKDAQQFKQFLDNFK